MLGEVTLKWNEVTVWQWGGDTCGQISKQLLSWRMASSSGASSISKVFILDKYFNELQKFWDTEKRLQGNFKDSTFINHKPHTVTPVLYP